MTTPVYCQETDIEALLQIAINGTSHPSTTELTTIINMMEDYIDDETHHSWRVKTVTNEYHKIPLYSPARWRNITLSGYAIPLNHRSIRSFDTGEGDKIEVWTGSQWVDYVVNKTEGRANDFWIDYTDGILWIRTWFLPDYKEAVRVTYRYGESSVPGSIKRACVYLTVVEVLGMEKDTANLPGGGDMNIDPVQARISRWRNDAEKIIDKFREIRTAE